jgi:DNA-binding transcriptional LysR family regulator
LNRRLLRDLDILTLHLFIAVCEEGTLTRAAEREAIAPSAVSKRLAELEASLGVALFVRQAKGMALTPAGQTMLYHSRRMIQNVHNIGIELGEYAKGVRGYVRMVANISSIVQFLPEDLEDFLSRHTEIKVDLVERPSGRVVDEIEDDKADLGICAGDTDTRHLIRVPYRRDHLLVVLRPDHRLAKEPSVAFRQTLEFDYVGLHGDSTIFARSVMASRQADMPLKLKIHVPSFDALCRMVQANLGIGLMPDRAFEVMGRPLGLRAIPLTDDWAERQLLLVHRGDRPLAPGSRMMLDHLATVGQPAFCA